MNILVLNGSPKKQGTISLLLKAVTDKMYTTHSIEWVNVYDLKMRPCIGCMKCRVDNVCSLPKDDAHIVGEKINNADGLVIGTPTHWGNMSSQLKLLFDRNVPVFMGEKPSGIPTPRQKGKSAVIVTACTTPWPFNFLAAESRGAIRAVKEVLHYGGYKVLGKIVKSGTKQKPVISNKLIEKAQNLGRRF